MSETKRPKYPDDLPPEDYEEYESMACKADVIFADRIDAYITTLETRLAASDKAREAIQSELDSLRESWNQLQAMRSKSDV